MQTKRVNFKNLIIASLILTLFALTLFQTALIFANGESDNTPLDTVEYLDYELNSPKAIYADEEVVAVTQAENTVFFYGGKIYEKNIKAAQQQLIRNGDKIYYSYNSLLYCVTVGEFTQTQVTDTAGVNIAANAFAINGNRLICLTNSGAVFYENFTQVPQPYEFEGEIDRSSFAAGNVYCTDEADYFCIDGEMYVNGKSVYFTKADYITDVNSQLFFTNKNGIFALEGSDVKQILSNTNAIPGREIKAAGISCYGGKLLFIDEIGKKIMQINTDGSELKEFLFSVEIETPAKVEFTASPETVSAEKGTRIHKGSLTDGKFVFSESAVINETCDYVKIGEIGGYFLLYGRNGYALINKNYLTEINQNTQITFEKGYILYNCYAYATCVASDEHILFGLEKDQAITVKSIYIMNGLQYGLIETDGGKSGFVLLGEIAETIYPRLPENSVIAESVTGKDNTLAAKVIILLSAGVFALALFVVFIKKDYFKL